MRFLITVTLGLTFLYGCNRTISQTNTNREVKDLMSHTDYKPNPNEVVISAKLISFEDGVVSAEVIKQLGSGFAAKLIINPGDKLSLSSSERPKENFICAFEYTHSMGDLKTYRITKFFN